MKFSEFLKLEGASKQEWFVLVPVTGFGLCGCGLPHGQSHEHLWSKGPVSKELADKVAENWGGRISLDPIPADACPTCSGRVGHQPGCPLKPR